MPNQKFVKAGTLKSFKMQISMSKEYFLCKDSKESVFLFVFSLTSGVVLLKEMQEHTHDE